MGNFRKLFLNDNFILGLIVINAITIFISEFDLNFPFFDYLEAAFTILFIIEMYVKISEQGFKVFFKRNWNKLDFVLVALSVPSLILLILGDYFVGPNIFLAVRVLRIFRSFRMLKFMPDVDAFISAIKRAVRASYVILFGFFILIFIVALISCALYKNVAPEYFANPAQSIYSVFQIFSVEGWYEIPNTIAERTNPTYAFFTKVYFSGMLMFGGILGLSFVNSIFVDAMVADNTDELELEVKSLNDKIDALEMKIDELLKRP